MLFSRTRLECNVLNLIVLIVLSGLFVAYSDFSLYSFDDIPFLRHIALALMLFHFFVIKKMRVWLGSFVVMFTFANYLFVISYLFVWEQGVREYQYWEMGYTAKQWIDGFLYGMCYIHAMFTGLLWNCDEKKQKCASLNMMWLNELYSPKMLFQIGIIMFALTLPCKLYVDLLTIITNRSGNGYSAVLSNNQVNGVVFNLSLLVNVSIIYIIASKYLSLKRVVVFFLLFYAYALAITTLSGGRRFTITALLATIPCLIHCYQIRVKLTQMLLLAGCGYFGLLFLKTVSATRHLLANSFGEYVEYALMYLKNSSPLFDAVVEFGNTIFPYVTVVDCYPKYGGYAMGKSIVFAWVLAIPGMGQLLPSLRGDISITKHVASFYKYWYGGAFGQELYGNFGVYAIAFAVLAGLLFSKLLGNVSSSSSIIVARYFALFYALLNLVRSDLNEFVRLILWAIFLPILIQNVLSRMKK